MFKFKLLIYHNFPQETPYRVFVYQFNNHKYASLYCIHYMIFFNNLLTAHEIIYDGIDGTVEVTHIVRYQSEVRRPL